MGNSNLKNLRKKESSEIEDELFTIETELINLNVYLNKIDKKTLSKLPIKELKYLRHEIQKIQYSIRYLNRTIERIKSDGQT